MVEMDSGEKRLNELGYKQELRREMVSLRPHFPPHLSCRDGESQEPCLLRCTDSVQDAGDIVLDDDAVYGDHTALRHELAVRRAGQSRLGVGRRLLLHLVRRHRHGGDLLLFPCKCLF